MLSIIEPRTPNHFDAVRRLCWEYRDFLLSLDEKSQRIVQTIYSQDKYARVMEAIEAEHSPPKGGACLALKGDQPVGCGMFHTIEPGVAEIKRVFVRDSARGTGAGRAIMLSLIQQCREQGFDLIRMDTGKPLQTATRLYLSMGFVLRDAYAEIPEIADGHLLFFEMKL
ncbi:N-acetylglutamate synthase [Ruegeria denitrificans]|uniref:N-acetylglutamate synthase n=1 Tax=Ruegeria denitrificans TaxID=1715692 RepID=A0A0P1I3P2_9RHOB|nr:GNAT family N-acetyltransferase [Ruegeria denitrificans]CUJ88510.1 N-acetylglutamate synthase [Ruegeria denitrificans]